MFKPNNFDSIKDPYYKQVFKDYQIAEHDLICYHAVIENRYIAPTGERQSTPIVQMYDLSSWNFQKANNGFLGLTVELIHIPDGGEDVAINAVELEMDEATKALLEKNKEENDALRNEIAALKELILANEQQGNQKLPETGESMDTAQNIVLESGNTPEEVKYVVQTPSGISASLGTSEKTTDDDDKVTKEMFYNLKQEELADFDVEVLKEYYEVVFGKKTGNMRPGTILNKLLTELTKE